MVSFLRMLRSGFGMGIVGVLVAVVGAAADPPQEKGASAPGKDFFPKQKYQPLPGKVVGVLAAGAQSLLSTEGRTAPADALYLGCGSGSYRLLYVPVKKRPLIGAMFVPVGEKGQPKRFDSLSPANPETVQQWGITTPFTLVEVEVNGGLGSPAKDSFVATHMKVLDGTPEYPLRVADVVEQLRRRYTAWVAEQRPRVRTDLLEAQKQALRHKQPTGPRETVELVHVTWLPESQRLRVRFQTRITDGLYRQGPDVPKWEKGRVVSAPGPRYGTSFGVELGMAFEVDRTGNVDQHQELPVQIFQKEIPAPAVSQ
jgi:hypothetical protein